jgi:predicted nucleic acid-binding protein
LAKKLSVFEDEPISTADHVNAAQAASKCIRAGVRPSSIDILLCAVALDRNWEILTVDNDFTHYQKVLKFGIHAHQIN